jgi:hypothetical protein
MLALLQLRHQAKLPLQLLAQMVRQHPSGQQAKCHQPGAEQ